MRYVIKDRETRKLLIDSKLEGYRIAFTQVNRIDEVWIYVSKTKEADGST